MSSDERRDHHGDHYGDHHGDPGGDPARGFLDQTVPRDDAWDGREPEEGPARPRHVQHPAGSDNVHDAKERRRQTVRNAAWTFGPGVAYLAGSAAFASADPEPEPPEADYGGFGEIGSGL